MGVASDLHCAVCGDDWVSSGTAEGAEEEGMTRRHCSVTDEE